MHPAARDFIAEHRPGPVNLAIECGSLDINGGVRDLFDAARYIGVDPSSGPGVDVVGNFADFDPGQPADVVVCCEVYEHTDAWRLLLFHAFELLHPGGLFLATCATDPRAPHSAVDGNGLREGEWYRNVGRGEMEQALQMVGAEMFRVDVDRHLGDLRVWAIR